MKVFIRLYYKWILVLASVFFIIGIYCQARINAEPSRHQPIAFIKHQDRIQKALSVIGNEDSDVANVTYNRNTHTLTYSVLYMRFLKRFQGSIGHKQTRHFKELAHIKSKVKMRVSKEEALRRQAIQKQEVKNQKKQNAIYAAQDKAAAEKRAAEAKQQAEEQAKKQKAQANKQKKQHQNHKKAQNKSRPKKTSQKPAKKNGKSKAKKQGGKH